MVIENIKKQEGVRSHFTTAKGTELPLLNLRGKEYLQVAHRIQWFREEKQDWVIETNFIRLEENYAVCKATILDNEKNIKSMAHKREDKQHFADFMEKSETGAIGRALALLGYGTQFTADELDEGKRIVDAPLNKTPQNETKSMNSGVLNKNNIVTPKQPKINAFKSISDEQRKLAFALANGLGWSQELTKEKWVEWTEKESSKDWTPEDFKLVIDKMKAAKDPKSFDNFV